MSETPRQRGRPKGTGIDDTASLQAIASLLAADHLLKPTTAIRRVGVTDPSVVRRLREKLKQTPPAPLVSSTPTATPATNKPSARDTSQPANQRADADKFAKHVPATPTAQPPLPQDTAARISSTAEPAQPQPKPTHPAPQPEPAREAPPQAAPQTPLPPPDPQLEALRLSAEAAAAMSRLYLHCINHAAQTSPLTLALSGQAMMSKWFASLMSAQIAAQQKQKP